MHLKLKQSRIHCRYIELFALDVSLTSYFYSCVSAKCLTLFRRRVLYVYFHIWRHFMFYIREYMCVSFTCVNLCKFYHILLQINLYLKGFIVNSLANVTNKWTYLGDDSSSAYLGGVWVLHQLYLANWSRAELSEWAPWRNAFTSGRKIPCSILT